MKRTVILFLVLCIALMGAQAVFAESTQPIEAAFLYVAPDGADTNAGTLDAPFATVDAAVRAARTIEGQVVINLRGGSYPASETIRLGAEDENLVIRAYQDEEPVLTGSQPLAFSDFVKASEEAQARIVDKNAKSRVVAVDLAAKGITEYGSLYVVDHGYSSNPNPPAFYINNKSMTLARYPNSDYLLTGKVVSSGVNSFSLFYKDQSWPAVEDVTDDMVFKFICNDSRMQNWKQADDIWMFGYWTHDWAEGRMGATIDFDNKTVVSKYPASFGVVEGRRFYFYNMLEEIDQPGEWYLDRTDGKLYVYPTDDFNASASIEYVTFNQPFFDVSNSRNVTIQGLRLDKSVGKGITGDTVEGLLVNDCEISNLSGNAVELKGARDCRVINSYLHDLGATGINITGGDRETLTPGNNAIENNKIERFGQIKTTYNPAATVGGVGNAIRYNEISDTPHMALGYGGNDHVIEYNEIYDVCKDTADSGAIYTGRDWSTRGNVIRYNYFHDMEMIDTSTNMEMQAVYLDDMHSSTAVFGNVFYRVDSVALFGGGRDNTFENNLMLECKKPFVMDARGTTWMETGEGSEIRNNLLKVPYQSDAWSKYPHLSNILEDEPKLPKYNVITNNVLYRTPSMNIDPLVSQHGTVENNIEISKTDSFANYKNKDFTVAEGSEIIEKLPDFEPIPFAEIGRRDYTVEDRYVEKDAAPSLVALAIGTPNAYANGAKTMVDTENPEVQPIVKDDRTLVPVRFIAESFGAEVGWDEATQTVTITLNGVTTTLVIGSKEMKVGDRTVTLDVEAQTMNDRTLLPLRAIAEEALGKTVFWDEAAQLIVISDGVVDVDVQEWMQVLEIN